MRSVTRMNVRALLLSLVAIACIHNGASSDPAASHTMADHTRMVFRVAAEKGPMLKGVRVSAIGRDGAELELGETDAFGNLSVAKDVLRSHDARVILFAHERFFTGAMRVDDPEGRFYDFDEQYIRLAVFGVL